MPWLKKTSADESSGVPSNKSERSTFLFHMVSTSTRKTFRPICVCLLTYASLYRHSFHRCRPHPRTGSPGSVASVGDTT